MLSPLFFKNKSPSFVFRLHGRDKLDLRSGSSGNHQTRSVILVRPSSISRLSLTSGAVSLRDFNVSASRALSRRFGSLPDRVGAAPLAGGFISGADSVLVIKGVGHLTGLQTSLRNHGDVLQPADVHEAEITRTRRPQDL